MSAQKLRNGQIALVTQGGLFIRLDATGKKQLKSFPVGQGQPFGGNFEVLSNGHVLVPLYNNNRVIEFDQEGQVGLGGHRQPADLFGTPAEREHAHRQHVQPASGRAGQNRQAGLGAPDGRTDLSSEAALELGQLLDFGVPYSPEYGKTRVLANAATRKSSGDNPPVPG